MQLNVAFLLSSAELAASLRMMGLAERRLKRDGEAEETLVSAMDVFKGPRIKSCLEKLYTEADDTMASGESCLRFTGCELMSACVCIDVRSHLFCVIH